VGAWTPDFRKVGNGHRTYKTTHRLLHAEKWVDAVQRRSRQTTPLDKKNK